MKLHNAVLTVIMAIIFSACSADKGGELKFVKFRAAFAPIESVKIYNEHGDIIGLLKNGERTAQLSLGIYYADIRDDLGNSVYDAKERLKFAVKATGAEVVLKPHYLKGISIPLVAVHVPKEEVGVRQQGLYSGAPTGDRGRLLWEATRAMVGSDDADDEDWSPAGTMYATASYVSTDTGAWSSMLSAYEGYACCVDDDLEPCYLTYPCSTVLFYECQGSSCSNNYHGGQCKAFSNLIAYRSGVFHGNNWAWKSLPSDTWISNNCDNTSSASIQAGDVLRYSGYHSMILARVFSSTSVMVIDSNWVGGNGNEKVGAHEMSFNGSGISDLDNYKVLDCVYDNDCSSSCN